MLQRLLTKRPAEIIVLLSAFLLLVYLNISSVFSQEPTPGEEPSPVPTEIPTELPSPTTIPPTETATATFTELPPPTATNTELPSPTATATLTETPVDATGLPTATLVETITETVTPTETPPPTITETSSPTPTHTPSATASPLSSPMPTPGTPNYSAVLLQQAQANGAQPQLLGECSTDITSESAIVAAPPDGDPGDLYLAIAEAHAPGSASPYPIYLCPGNFPLSQTAAISADINIYGQGIDVSTIYQSERNIDVMGGMFTLNDSHVLSFYNVTVKEGQALSVTYGATVGGAIKIWSGTLNIYDSKFENNQAYSGGAIGWGDNISIERSIFLNNAAVNSGGALNVGDMTADCARFDTNEASSDVGGAITIDGGGSITNSLFRGNTASGDGAHIYNGGTLTIAEGNWWGASSPQDPGEVSGVDADPVADHDPTGDKECGYHLNVIDDGTRSWSAFEKQSISDGITQVSQAFDFLAGTVNTREDAFNLVMLENSGTEILFSVRVSHGYDK